jgi:general secretion pathway protein H
MRRSDRRGFTLLEVLVALLLIGLAATMTVNLVTPQTQRATLIAFRAALETRFAEISAAARLRGMPVAMRFDRTQRRIDGGDLAPLVIPADVSLKLISAREAGDAATGAVLFFPDGTNTGLSYELASGGFKERGALSWLGGRTAIAR